MDGSFNEFKINLNNRRWSWARETRRLSDFQIFDWSRARAHRCLLKVLWCLQRTANIQIFELRLGDRWLIDFCISWWVFRDLLLQYINMLSVMINAINIEFAEILTLLSEITYKLLQPLSLSLLMLLICCRENLHNSLVLLAKHFDDLRRAESVIIFVKKLVVEWAETKNRIDWIEIE